MEALKRDVVLAKLGALASSTWTVPRSGCNAIDGALAGSNHGDGPPVAEIRAVVTTCEYRELVSDEVRNEMKHYKALQRGGSTRVQEAGHYQTTNVTDSTGEKLVSSSTNYVEGGSHYEGSADAE